MDFRIPLTEIYNTIEEYNNFLKSIWDEPIIRQEYCDTLAEKNKAGEYESFMKEKTPEGYTRWNDMKWWMTAAINYNEMSMTRIRDGKFRPTHLTKLDANSTMKVKIRKDGANEFKNQLADAWFGHCEKSGGKFKYGTFQLAQEIGVDEQK